MFGLFKKKPGGQLKYYDLWDWWINTFNDGEREVISSTFQPLGGSENTLTEGEIYSSSGSATSLLSSLAGWFKQRDQRTLAYRILDKAEELAGKAPVLDKHFLYQAKIEIYYRFRDVDNFAMSKAVEGCEQQIELSPQAVKAFKKEYPDAELPRHVGYEQLAIIRDKEGNLSEAIEVCKKAHEQGWGGDWQQRIERYKKKLRKQG